ncbi:hypothetical protein [Bradyrhizobium sp. USDA 10063]
MADYSSQALLEGAEPVTLKQVVRVEVALSRKVTDGIVNLSPYGTPVP